MIVEVILSAVTLLSLGNSVFNKPKPVTVTEYKTVVVTAPVDLLTDCLVQEPPDIEAYKQAPDWNTKEKILVSSMLESQKKTINCNTQMNALRTWNDKQIQLYSNQPKSDQKKE